MGIKLKRSRKSGWLACVLVAVLGFLAGTAALAQGPPEEQKASGKRSAEAAEKQAGESKPANPTVSLPRVSTDEAAQEAARKATQKTTTTEGAKASDDGGVTELRPATKEETKDSGSVVTEPGKDKNPHKIHGRIEGSTASGQVGGGSVGGAVGGRSKSGKSSIYVETEKGSTQVSTPR